MVFHEYEKGGVPPATFTVALPLLSPKQIKFVTLEKEWVIIGSTLIVTVPVLLSHRVTTQTEQVVVAVGVTIIELVVAPVLHEYPIIPQPEPAASVAVCPQQRGLELADTVANIFDNAGSYSQKSLKFVPLEFSPVPTYPLHPIENPTAPSLCPPPKLTA